MVDVVDGRRNRRITAETVFELTGPAAGSDLVKTAADPEVAGSRARWATAPAAPRRGARCCRARRTSTATSPGPPTRPRRSATAARRRPRRRRGWEAYDPRFDAHDADYVNEPNRFGYIVEIDPSDPTATPLKHTAMGRFKHEGANVTIAEDGRVVAYMGDDERNDYLYKFVSKGRYTAATSTGARSEEHAAPQRGRPLRRTLLRQLAGR